MTDHKFEPFQKVLVRDGDRDLWRAGFFSHNDGNIELPFCCVGEDWRFCIPYTSETAHLLGTSQPYEPPKPPVDESKRFKCGEWVEVLHFEKWVKALFLFYNGAVHCAFVPSGNKPADTFDPDQIRPLLDSADIVKCGRCGKYINGDTAVVAECGLCCPEHYKNDTAAH